MSSSLVWYFNRAGRPPSTPGRRFCEAAFAQTSVKMALSKCNRDLLKTKTGKSTFERHLKDQTKTLRGTISKEIKDVIEFKWKTRNIPQLKGGRPPLTEEHISSLNTSSNFRKRYILIFPSSPNIRVFPLVGNELTLRFNVVMYFLWNKKRFLFLRNIRWPRG